MTNDRVEAAYRAHHPRLWRALYAYTGDRELASDAEAEAFSQALRRGTEIDDVAAWVWKSAFKIAGGMLSNRRATPSSGAPEAHAVPSSTVEFVALLGALSPQQRACIVLRYIGGFRSAEIATMLGTSAGTVRVQLHRAHHSLRSTLRVDEEMQ